MNKLILFLLFVFATAITTAQTIYSKAFGSPQNKAIIFVHGGPSGNAVLFEATTAETLASKGFYVIVYDRCGEGRSIDTTATFTYAEAINDLKGIYQQYHLSKAVIIGHSFGGLVATLFTKQNPDKVSSLILAGALVSQQATYNHILDTAKSIYRKANDADALKKILVIEQINKHSADYRKACFDVASDLHFFNVQNPDEENIKLHQQYESSELFKQNIRNKNAPLLFYKNEARNNIDVMPELKKIQQQKVQLYAIYGKQDGIFSTRQLKQIKQLTGNQHFALLNNCSHYLFVDQQQKFIQQLIQWLQKR